MDKVLCVLAAVVLTVGCVDEPIYITDARDGRTYRTVKINGKRWMAKNLNYQTHKYWSWCYKNDTSNCEKYGRLYDWYTAVWEACPAGWHLPDTSEWNELVTFAGGKETAGAKLKSKMPFWDGMDDYEFSAKAGGYIYSLIVPGNRHFAKLEHEGKWWTATEENGGTFNAYSRNMRTGGTDVGEYINGKSLGLSVRCLRD